VGPRRAHDARRRLAAVKACGPGAALSHRSAAALWHLLPCGEHDLPEVTVPTAHGRKIPGILVRRTRTRNEFEDAVLDLIDTGGFTRPDVNKSMLVGGKRTKPDFRWPELRLVIEADGGQWHDHPLAREDDAERQARLEAAGERVIRVSWNQAMFSPKQTIARLNAAGAPSRPGVTAVGRPRPPRTARGSPACGSATAAWRSSR
jgi:very-short-patch-repair endonuclease